MKKQALIGKTLTELQTIALELGEPKFRAKQIAEWLYKHNISSIQDMLNLSKPFRQALEEKYCLGKVATSDIQVSIDGTEKYLFPVLVNDMEQSIEAVYIPEGDRATLCVSSQVGCKMNCSFCHTGKMGFLGNLSASQIINQVLSCRHSENLTNIVFMGMGEPLDNYKELAKVLDILTASWGLAWSPKRITVSTIGPPVGLQKLLSEQDCHVAISIHSPYPQERAELMPVEKAYPISDIIGTLQQHDFSKQRRLSFEYILFDNLNDDIPHARQLHRILKPLMPHCRVNLIRYHQIPGIPLASPTSERVEAFETFLNKYGLRCTTRRSRGEDIFAACGMLATEKRKRQTQ